MCSCTRILYIRRTTNSIMNQSQLYHTYTILKLSSDLKSSRKRQARRVEEDAS